MRGRLLGLCAIGLCLIGLCAMGLCAIDLATRAEPSMQLMVAAETAHLTKKDRSGQVGPVNVRAEADLAEYLSSYHLFRDPRRQLPNDGVIPYDLNTPHFSDYATLHRFIWIPQGRACQYVSDGKLIYPVGSAIILTAGYPHDIRAPDQGEHVVETRLWIRKPDGWVGAQYVWNEEMTDARLTLAGHQVDVSWLHSDGETRDYTYRVPNKNQCLQCHEIDDQLIPLGPLHARYLNKSFTYEHGAQNQLEYWAQVGYLTGLPRQADQIPRVPVWDDPTTGNLDSRARAYLDMNCSSCHRPGGIAMTSGLDLTFDQDEPVRFGVFKAPVAAGRGTGTGRFVIEPGKPDQSIMVIRMQSTDPGVRMPIVGRGLQHQEGVELIRQWISEMKFPEMAQSQHNIDQRFDSRWKASKASAVKQKRPNPLESL